LFRTHLPELLARYEAEFALRLGRFCIASPHRQIVFTFPKVLRVLFHHDCKLDGRSAASSTA
jgi:hypothetical protein